MGEPVTDAPPLLPLVYEGDGNWSIANKAWGKRCDELYVVHERYAFSEVDTRNMKLHAAYFASIGEAWKNLPEGWGDYFKSPDHLRKYCLIKEGYCTTATFTLANEDEALAFAAYFRVPGESGEFRIIERRGNVVVVNTARSQQVLRKGKGMDADTFKSSSRAVLNRLDIMLGTSRGTVAKQRASA